MRLELAGTLVTRDPVVVSFQVSNTGETSFSFDATEFRVLGYTKFDVICIGAGGGMGGSYDSENTGSLLKSFGGAGGGGGIHRVQGILSELPPVVPVVVGAGGLAGHDDSNPNLTTNGNPGGYSSFNEDTCMASGGKGGTRVRSNIIGTTTTANGGDGGIGDRTIAGGGGTGGMAGFSADPGPGTPGTSGADGTWNGSIGSGGGGGAGGVGRYGSGGATLNAATAGGRGAYNASDLSVYALGGAALDDLETGSQEVIPGFAGGAKGTPLNGVPIIFGSSKSSTADGDDGVVIIRLSVE
jgi:Glycine-rich domain